MDVFSLPYRAGLLRSFIDDFEIGQFGDGFFGKVSRGRATLQFYLTGDFGNVTLQVYPLAGLMLVSSKVPLGEYLKAAAKQHGIDPRDVVWEYRDLACVLKERNCEPVLLSAVISELPWALTTFKERGIMIACGCDVTADDSLPQKEVSPPWVVPGVNTALAFFRDLVPWATSEPPAIDCMGLEDAIDRACMARNVVVLRGLLKQGAPRQTAFDHCLANKDVPCMSALAAVLPPTGEQLHAIARAVSLHDFLKIHNSMAKRLGSKTD
jgi:hypothetical protein